MSYFHALNVIISFDELQPRAFSFNSPFGACETCDGIGTKVSIDPDLVVPDKNKSLVQGCIVPIGEQPRGNWYSSILKTLAFHYDFNFTTAWKNLKENVKEVLLFWYCIRSINENAIFIRKI